MGLAVWRVWSPAGVMGLGSCVISRTGPLVEYNKKGSLGEKKSIATVQSSRLGGSQNI